METRATLYGVRLSAQKGRLVASLKRFQARAKGRGNRITKRTCHIFVTVGDEEKKAPAKQTKK